MKALHPTDDRYLVDDLVPYISDEAFLGYKLKVEAAYAQALSEHGVCSEDVANAITEKANTNFVTKEEVDAKEAEIKHDIRAMVEVLKSKLPENARPYVHLGLTSYDVVDTAYSLMIRDATVKVVLPDMTKFVRTLMDLAEREKDTVQIGRTHGQHAEPTTFGREIAVYVERFGNSIDLIGEKTLHLKGKISGAVGTKAQLMLLVDDPDRLEKDVLYNLDLLPSGISTQIINPEDVADYFSRIMIAFGILDDFANDMRQLQRSEIGEVYESFDEKQVGSSTMPHKRNPIGWENICSQYRAVMPHLMSVFLDIQSEHQRDLRNSASKRYYTAEILNAFDYSVRRADRMTKKLEVDREAMERNLDMSNGMFLAEPAYIALAKAGHPDAHEHVRRLTMMAREDGTGFSHVLANDKNIQDAISELPKDMQKIFSNPKSYIGLSVEMVEETNRRNSEKMD